MRNRTQKVNIPSSGGDPVSLFWTPEDLLVVQKVRANAERDGIDWHSEILGPSAIQKAADQLSSGGQKCGPARAYRIQKLIPVLPEVPEGELLDDAAAPEVHQKAEPLAEGPGQSDQSANQKAEASSQSGSLDQKALTLWQKVTYRKAERAEQKAEDPDLLAEGEASGKPERAWPLILIAASAFVALWGGWVTLGEMTGFGAFKPLPGFIEWTVNASITLPLGVEVLAAYAIRAWLSGYGTARTRRLAKRSAIGCLILGAGGQVASHLMEVAGIAPNGAPWQITAFVSIIPIISLGTVSGLFHLLSTDRKAHRARQKLASQIG